MKDYLDSRINFIIRYKINLKLKEASRRSLHTKHDFNSLKSLLNLPNNIKLNIEKEKKNLAINVH